MAPPAEPWLADRRWRRDGAVDESHRLARRALVTGGLVTGVAALIASSVLPGLAPGEALLPALMLALPFLLGLGLIGRGVLTVLRRARFGALELTFARFPFLLGGPLEVALVRDPGAAPLPGLTAALCCVEERVVEVPGGEEDGPGRPRTMVERVVRWREERPVAVSAGARLPIRFELPSPGGPAGGTWRAGPSRRWWELRLTAPVPGLALDATFVLPVYEPPPGGRTGGSFAPGNPTA